MPSKDELAASIARAVGDVRSARPLVGSITNVITIDFVANAQLAVGGSAAMVYMAEEGEALARASSGFYINMGSMLPVHDPGVIATATALHDAGVPWVLDPVGIGIGRQRERILRELQALRPSVIRCNATEAIALAELWGLGEAVAATSAADAEEVHVVESADDVSAARGAAIALARETGGAVAVSGESDLVTDGDVVIMARGGSEHFTRVTGSGCSLGGVAAVYSAVAAPLVAALTATAIYDVAGAMAHAKAEGPASFKVAFLDALYGVAPGDVAACDFDVERA